MPSSLSGLIDAHTIVLLQDECTGAWHKAIPEMNPETTGASFPLQLEALHRANFILWHAEDDARLPQAADSTIAAVKRRIDSVNQERNDTVERIDAMLLVTLQEHSIVEQGEQHSETPGMMIDRLSILSLKIFHTRQEVERMQSPTGHRERNITRSAMLQNQRGDLMHCLDRLWSQVCGGKRYYRQYRQLKMYNDPELNPVLYRAKTEQAET